MLDISLLRNKYNEVVKKINSRGKNYPQLIEFKQVDEQWRTITTKIQELQSKRNSLSDQIGQLVKEGKKDQIANIKDEVVKIKQEIETLSNQCNELDKKLHDILYSIPNLPDADVPLGKDENDNKEVKKWGKLPKFSFAPLSHWELAEKLGLADFERASKLSGARHTIFKGDGARLMRALRNFTLDVANQFGFTEMQPPILINDHILQGTGHLPKSKEDMFETLNGQFLSPTEEVPLTGYYNKEIIDVNLLPIKMTSSTLSFRSEAGSAGKDVRGVIRQHQFYNTELVVLCKEDDSEKQLDLMVKHVEKVLQLLAIPYHILLLCTGDMGFAAAKTFDIEVWFPCNNKYREISSCSNCRDFQARGSAIKYRLPEQPNNSYFVHTLNGTATSLNRLWVAVVENYQQKDGSIKIPLVLQKYMNNTKVIGLVKKTPIKKTKKVVKSKKVANKKK